MAVGTDAGPYVEETTILEQLALDIRNALTPLFPQRLVEAWVRDDGSGVLVRVRGTGVDFILDQENIIRHPRDGKEVIVAPMRGATIGAIATEIKASLFDLHEKRFLEAMRVLHRNDFAPLSLNAYYIQSGVVEIYGTCGDVPFFIQLHIWWEWLKDWVRR